MNTRAAEDAGHLERASLVFRRPAFDDAAATSGQDDEPVWVDQDEDSAPGTMHDVSGDGDELSMDCDASGDDHFEFTATDCAADRLRSSRRPGRVSIDLKPVNDEPEAGLAAAMLQAVPQAENEYATNRDFLLKEIILRTISPLQEFIAPAAHREKVQRLIDEDQVARTAV